MIIGIDGNEANIAERVGVSWYVYHLLHEFAQLANKDLSIRVFLREKPKGDLPPPSSYLRYVVVPGTRLWSQLFLPLQLFLFHRDLSVFLAPAHYAPRLCPCPTLVVVHDVSYRYYPEDFRPRDLFQLMHWTSYSVKQSSLTVAVSKQTKHDLMAQYQLPDAKVQVIYNGFAPPEGTKQKKTDTRYQRITYIGTLQPRKNIETLLEAFALLRQKHPDYTLMLVGKKGWLYEDIFIAIERYKLGNSVTVTGYVTEEEKYRLLGESDVIVMPGYYEGFGLPLLEAFWMGVPVVASSTGSLPEIGGNACVYTDPADSIGMAKAIEGLINNSIVRNRCISLGKERVETFTWKRTAQELIAACGQVRKDA